LKRFGAARLGRVQRVAQLLGRQLGLLPAPALNQRLRFHRLRLTLRFADLRREHHHLLAQDRIFRPKIFGLIQNPANFCLN
jgi:hypothetical protein